MPYSEACDKLQPPPQRRTRQCFGNLYDCYWQLCLSISPVNAIIYEDCIVYLRVWQSIILYHSKAFDASLTFLTIMQSLVISAQLCGQCGINLTSIFYLFCVHSAKFSTAYNVSGDSWVLRLFWTVNVVYPEISGAILPKYDREFMHSNFLVFRLGCWWYYKYLVSLQLRHSWLCLVDHASLKVIVTICLWSA